MEKFEIFTVEQDGLTKNSSINTLLGYPDEETKTERYRELIKKYNQSEWAGVVDDDLVNACASMTPSERAVYYDDSDLKTYQWLIDNNWFEQP